MPRKGTKDHPKQYGRKRPHPQPPNRWELKKSKSFTSTSAQKILQSGEVYKMTEKATSAPVAVVTSEDTPATQVAGPKKAASAAKSSKPRATPAHPKNADMVTAAIAALKERGGSSLQAIKKYMASTYKIDTEKQATFIKKYLKAAVASGTLVQTKGKGAAGSFKLAKVEAVKPTTKSAAKAKAPKKVPAVKKPATTKKASPAKKAPAKKPTASPVSPKKKAASKAPAAKPPKPKTTKANTAPKSPGAKSKPTTAKTTKPVAAKPKKVGPKKTVSAKK